ncbi:MAG: type II secretion system major pseudopilin GspG [Deltaproteobacteria bacterium]|nr:type II secretion system major pseudopilin GspG [Deltaproteobacteria bacterium]
MHRYSRLGRRTSKTRQGITFIEILVVLIIIALIAGIVGTEMIGEAEKSRAAATRIQIQSLDSSLKMYRLHNSTFPSTEQGLQALVVPPTVGILPRNWQGPYIQKVPKDGWGGDFIYRNDGQRFVIVSLGADGVEGGEDLNADISSDTL